MALARRQLRAYVVSPVTHVAMTIFVFASGYFFSNLLVYYVRQSVLADRQIARIGRSDLQLDVPTVMLSQFFKNEGFILLVVVPLLTMGLIANERRNGTIALLLRWSVSSWNLVAGTFLAALVLFAVMVLPTLPLHWFLARGGAWEPGAVAAGYLGLLLLAAAELSLGLFVSALSGNVVASMFGAGGLLAILNFAHMSRWAAQSGWGDVVGVLSFYLHYANFTRGVVAVSDVVYFLTWVAVGLFLTERSIEISRSTRRDAATPAGRFPNQKAILPLPTLISFVLLAGCLGLVNGLAWYKPVQVDLTASGRNTLSAESRAAIATVTRDVVVRQFGRTRDPRVDRILATVAASSRHIRQEFVDAGRHPAEARRYGVVTDGTVVVASGSMYRKVEHPTERAIVNAMLQVSDPAGRTICFVTGHGEHGLDDGSATGLSGVASALEASNLKTEQIALLDARMPSGCSVLVIAGPRQDFGQMDGDRLTAFAESAGGVAVLIDPAPGVPLVSWLKPWGVTPGGGVIVDTSGAGEGAGRGPQAAFALTYGDHPITRGFDIATMYDTARPLDVTSPASGDGPVVLARTGTLSIERTEGSPGPPRQGPLTLAVAASLTRTPGPNPTTPGEARVAVFGDSDFVTNALIGRQGNRDLFLRTIFWLAGEDDAAIGPVRDLDNRRVRLTERTMTWMYVVGMGLLPLLPLLAGFTVVGRSRRRCRRVQ